MSRGKRRRHGKQEHFVRLFSWVLCTAAYRSLDPVARSLLVELYRLYVGPLTHGNGTVFMSVREAALRLNVGKDTASRAFRMLQARGFIRAHRKGSFDFKSVEGGHRATIWILTEHGAFGQPPTKEFASWKTPADDLPVSSNGPRRPNIRCDFSGPAVSTEGPARPDAQQNSSNCP